MFMTSAQVLFAGLWSEIWHWGVGVALIILLVGGAVFSQSIPVIGPYLAPIRKDMLWAAAAVVLLLVGEYIGLRDEKARCVAQQVVIEHVVDKAVAGTKTPAAKAAKDPYDQPDN